MDADEVAREYNFTQVTQAEAGAYDAMILAVAYREFREMGARGNRELGKPKHVLYDLKYLLSADENDIRL